MKVLVGGGRVDAQGRLHKEPQRVVELPEGAFVDVMKELFGMAKIAVFHAPEYMPIAHATDDDGNPVAIGPAPAIGWWTEFPVRGAKKGGKGGKGKPWGGGKGC